MMPYNSSIITYYAYNVPKMNKKVSTKIAIFRKYANWKMHDYCSMLLGEKSEKQQKSKTYPPLI